MQTRLSGDSERAFINTDFDVEGGHQSVGSTGAELIVEGSVAYGALDGSVQDLVKKVNGNAGDSEVTLVNTLHELELHPERVAAGNLATEDVGLSPAQRGADGSVYVNMDANDVYRKQFATGGQHADYAAVNPINLAAALYHELVESEAGDKYRGQGVTGRKDVYAKADAEAVDAENQLRLALRVPVMLPRKAQSGATDAEKQAITSKGDALRAQANAVNAPIVEYSGWMDEYLDIPKTFAGDRAARLAKGKELHSDRYTEKNDREGLPCRHSMPNQLYFEVKAHGATYRIRVDHGKNAVVTPKDVRLGG